MEREDRIAPPPLTDDILASQLDPAARRDLRGLQKDTAEAVARHLVAAGSLVDTDPEQALAHARYARQRASRIAVVREAAGIAAYHAGEWTEALGELRAARRMGGGPGHLAVMADIERALGRPERAVELARGPEARELDTAAAIELAIVTAGARRDLGELDAAVVGLQGAELDPARRQPWSARLFYAYADNLFAAGREADALQWFVHAADADEHGETDAARRIAELTGEPLPEEEDEDAVLFGVEDDASDAADAVAADADAEVEVEVEVAEGAADAGADAGAGDDAADGGGTDADADAADGTDADADAAADLVDAAGPAERPSAAVETTAEPQASGPADADVPGPVAEVAEPEAADAEAAPEVAAVEPVQADADQGAAEAGPDPGAAGTTAPAEPDATDAGGAER